jgi:purine-binding chemotaxis protein CheW
VIFRIERRVYALAADMVAEVIRVPMAARVPQAPKALLGVANLRGAVMPLASLRALLGLGEAEHDAASRAIVMGGGAPVAIVVDAVDDFVMVETGSVQTQTVDLSVEQGERLSGAFPLGAGRGAAKILDIQALLTEAFAHRARPQRESQTRSFVAAQIDRSASERETLVTFEIAGQEFAIDLALVHEIIAEPESVAAAPRAEALVLGMLAFRDRLLPLLSLRGLLGFEPAPATDGRGKIIIASVRDSLVGFVVDRARAVLSVDPALIDPAPPVLVARVGGEARVKSIYRGEGGKRLISILSPERLFREEVMQRLEAAQSVAPTQMQNERAHEERIFLVFRLGDDEFGLPVESVDEVARVPAQITKVPRTPKFLEGVVNIRGDVIPVIDLRPRFDMPRLEQSDGRRLIVVRSERHRAGLIVDSVSQVLRTKADAIEAAPDLTDDITRLVRGVVNLEGEGRIVLVLDPAEILTRSERGLLDAFERKLQTHS